MLMKHDFVYKQSFDEMLVYSPLPCSFASDAPTLLNGLPKDI